MSSTSDDEYGNPASKLQAMKQNWNPGITNKVDTVDSDCPSDSDKSPLVLDHPSPKVTKNKKLKKRIPAKKISATDSTGSTESDISRTCKYLTRAQVSSVGEQEHSGGEGGGGAVLAVAVGGTSGVLARSRRARGTSRRTGATRGTRRSRGRNRLANPQTLINLGCWSDDEGSQPIFAKPQSKDIVEVELDTSDLVNYFDKESSDKESENEELSVKVHWRSKEYHKFPIRKYQKLSRIFEFYSELENVPMDHLLLTLKERILRPQDTPAHINYNVWDFIEGGVVAHSVTQMAEESARKFASGLASSREAAPSVVNGKKLMIKLQSKDMKAPFKVAIGKDQKFSFAMMMFSEEFELPLEKLKFYLDGDQIDGESTPSKLDIEDGECIDVMVLA